MKLKGSLKLDKVYDVDGTDMYGVLLQDHTLDDVVDELNCLMDYIRVLNDKVEELIDRPMDEQLRSHVRESWSKDQQSDEPTGEYSDYIEGYIEHMKEVVWEVWE
jgi:hypothetical protein